MGAALSTKSFPVVIFRSKLLITIIDVSCSDISLRYIPPINISALTGFSLIGYLSLVVLF